LSHLFHILLGITFIVLEGKGVYGFTSFDKKMSFENIPYIIPELSHCLIFELHL